MTKNLISHRRQFIKQSSLLATGAILQFPIGSGCKESVKKNLKDEKLTFGVLADVHADLIPDKMERLEKFITKAIDHNVNFIVQLGDFCFPKQENNDFLNLWNQFDGPKYHLLGNHDMDISSKQVTMDFWRMSQPFYSFDQKGIHFVVLDPNFLYVEGQYRDYDNANFYVNDSLRTFINPDQISWLKEDLSKTNLQTIIFSHQSLINPSWGIKNRLEIQEILENTNNEAGFQKVIACFNGHDHIDFQREVNGIHYIEINSMSYQWLGEKYRNRTRYPAELYERYQHLDKIASYKDSLFAFVEIDKTQGQMKIEGVQSEWLSPSPSELNIPEQVYGMQYSAQISNRLIEIEK